MSGVQGGGRVRWSDRGTNGFVVGSGGVIRRREGGLCVCVGLYYLQLLQLFRAGAPHEEVLAFLGEGNQECVCGPGVGKGWTYPLMMGRVGFGGEKREYEG